MAQRKNVLLFFSDQFRYDTIAGHGDPMIKTPALDSLLAAGTDFTNAYTPCPVCIAARFSLHSGLAPYENPCNDNVPMPKGHPSFMGMLSGSGYQTHGVGKMHFEFTGEPNSILWGYDSRDVSEECNNPDDFRRFLDENGFDHVQDPQGVRSDMYYIPQPSQLPARLHNNTWVAQKSIDFLKNRDTEKPFFLMTSFIKPHPPFEAPVPWNKLYRCNQMEEPYRPEGFEELLVYVNQVQNRYKGRAWGYDVNLARMLRAAYYSCVSFVDYNIGLVLQYLRENDLLKDTVILFSADHGEMLGDYGSYGKRCFLDPSAHIPLILVDPDREGGKTCDAPVTLTDVLPTLLQNAGLPCPESYIGSSLWDIAEGKTDREFVCGQFNSEDAGLYMIKTRQYKYIYSAADRKELLFDQAAQGRETKNLAGEPAYQELKAKLAGMLIAHFRERGAEAPFDGDFFRLYPQPVLPEGRDAILLSQDPPATLPHIPGYERDCVIKPNPNIR